MDDVYCYSSYGEYYIVYRLYNVTHVISFYGPVSVFYQLIKHLILFYCTVHWHVNYTN